MGGEKPHRTMLRVVTRPHRFAFGVPESAFRPLIIDRRAHHNQRDFTRDVVLQTPHPTIPPMDPIFETNKPRTIEPEPIVIFLQNTECKMPY